MKHTSSQEKIVHKHTSTVRRVLARIEQERVIPQSRWTSRAYNYLLWCMALVAIIIASFAVAAIFFMFVNAGWQYASTTHGTFFIFLLAVIPPLWIGAVVIASLISYWYVRRTTHGYRYPLLLIVSGIVLLSLSLGAALFSTGLGQEIEEGVGQHIPFYQPFLQRERSWWSDADNGLLVGKVVSLASDFSSFVLKTDEGVLHVNASDLRVFDIAVLARGGTVRVVGVPLNTGGVATTTQTFHACFVFPWNIQGLPHKVPVPLPVAPFTASTSERITHAVRSNLCKGVRSYKILRNLEAHDNE